MVLNMPYIKESEKEKFGCVEINGIACTGPGELNYVLTKVCLGYLSRQTMLSYAMLNDVIGALECCKLEMTRRMVAPYEDSKIKENGDAY